MGLFSRKRGDRPTGRIIPPAVARRLPAIGQAIFHEGQLGLDVTDFYLPSFLAAGAPNPGTPGWDDFTDRFLDELLTGARAGGGWGAAGALYVAKDFVSADDISNPRFQRIVDDALTFMAHAGVPSVRIPMFAMQRWREIEADTS
jgi:hypothetical protein